MRTFSLTKLFSHQCTALPFLLVWAFIATAASQTSAHDPVDFLEVCAVKPGVLVEHDVELECPRILKRTSLDLRGPEFIAAGVGGMDRSAPDGNVLLTVYRVTNQLPYKTAEVSTLDLARGNASEKIKIQGRPEFFLSPAQMLKAGKPDPIPEGLDHYLAFKVIDGPDVSREIQISGSPVGSVKRKMGKLMYVCLPVAEWHHDEHFEITHPSICFSIYELSPSASKQESKLNILDQFGLNQLTCDSSKWLMARGTLFNK